MFVFDVIKFCFFRKTENYIQFQSSNNKFEIRRRKSSLEPDYNWRHVQVLIEYIKNQLSVYDILLVFEIKRQVHCII